jgi:hypothetical protein
MAVFIELVTAATPALDGAAQRTRVRRPLRGLELKEDTYAYVKLVKANGESIELVDSSSETGYSKEYSNFILQSVQESRMERQQIVETFGDTYLFLFGESPRMLQVSAILVNSFDFNWKAEFDYNYENYLRGTKSLEKGARTYLFYDENVVEGYIINAVTSYDSQMPQQVQLQFQFFVTNRRNISFIKTDGNFPIRSSAVVPAGGSLTKEMDFNAYRKLIETSGNYWESAFVKQDQTRTSPLRSKTADNYDEYTTGTQPSERAAGNSNYYEPSQKVLQLNKYTMPLAWALSKAMSAYGVLQSKFIGGKGASSPFLANLLGVGPSFLPGGVGMGGGGVQSGTRATFGAVPSPVPGGFARPGAVPGAGLGSTSSGISSFGGAYSGRGVAASASAGAYPSSGYGYGSGRYSPSNAASARTYNQTRGSSFGSSTPSLGSMSRAELAYLVLTGGVFGFTNSMKRVGGEQSAYGYPSPAAKAGYSGYAYESTRAASRAGGYAGAGGYMGYSGYYAYAGSSYAGKSGSGASVDVGGATSAFSTTCAPGELSNVSMPAWAALASGLV